MKPRKRYLRYPLEAADNEQPFDSRRANGNAVAVNT